MKNDFSDSVDNRFVQIILFYLLYFFTCCIKNKPIEEGPASVSSEDIARAHAVHFGENSCVDARDVVYQPGVV
jgi:hypothetical protein